MTDTRVTPETGRLEIRGERLVREITRGAESWQFFAFFFGAALTLLFGMIDLIEGWPT